MTPGILFWLLLSAFHEGKHEALRGAIEAHLAVHDAPDLRAAYAALLADPERRLEEVRRAYKAKQTAYTAFQLAHISTDLDEALEVLEVGLRLAERGRPYEAARAAGVYSWRLREAGDYSGAVHWGRYALDQFDERGFGDYKRRLRIVNDWAYARLLTGQAAGLEPLLSDGLASLEGVHDALARRFRSTFADLCLALGFPRRALELYERNLKAAPRQVVGEYSFYVVRALVEVGMNERAVEQAAYAKTLTYNLNSTLQGAYADLAVGLSYLQSEPTLAKESLIKALRFFEVRRIADYEARARLYLAHAHLSLGEEGEVRKLLGAPCFRGLAPAGLALLAGPEETFKGVFSFMSEKKVPLEFRLLGRREIWFEGKRVVLNALHTEIAAILAIKGRPLSLEELAEEFTTPSYTKSSLKSELSRLRKLLPVSTHPYHLEVPYTADFEEVITQLNRGDIKRALSLYRGELLPGSEVSLIRNLSTYLLDVLRQAVINANDLEGSLQLLDYTPLDLELLELAERLVGTGDPRSTLIKTRATKLRQEWGV